MLRLTISERWDSLRASNITPLPALWAKVQSKKVPQLNLSAGGILDARI
jgi:hypothetical protein